jgi:hypothetical protein
MDAVERSYLRLYHIDMVLPMRRLLMKAQKGLQTVDIGTDAE